MSDPTTSTTMQLTALPLLHAPSPQRAWHSTPHPSLPLLSTSLGKSSHITSLRTSKPHSVLEGGHTRSIRATAWKPHLPTGELGLVTGSFDGTAGVWRRDESAAANGDEGEGFGSDAEEKEDWEFSVVLEGHDAEVKSLAFSPSGQYLATCSRDKSIWIWEEVDGADEWETVAVLTEHEGDVKCVAWAPASETEGECLASSSYDGSVRVWREDGEGEWGCVGVLEEEGEAGETVWGVAWEGDSASTSPSKSDAETKPEGESADGLPKSRKALRLITCSADSSLRVWTRVEAAESTDGDAIPSTMRAAAQGEKWVLESVLPVAHTRAIYAVAWSEKTGRVVSCGGDSKIVVYGEVEGEGEKSEEVKEGEGEKVEGPGAGKWKILAETEMGHGPYEINHVTWCQRFDGGEGEMVVSSGDDGAVRAWAVAE